MYNLGLVSVSFRKNTPDEILCAMKSAGLGFIEWGSDVHAPFSDEEKLREIVALQNEYSVKCSSYGTYFRIGETPKSDLIGYIKAAKLLGTDILRLWAGSKGIESFGEEEKEEFLCECRELARIAESEGVKLCLECHNGTFTDTLKGALYLMENVDSPAFGMYWQPNQLRTFEENLRYAEQISKYTKTVHVFNWSGKDKYPLKDGEEAWVRYLEFFRNDINLLLEFMPDGKLETLITEADSLIRIAGISEAKNENSGNLQ